MSALEDLVGSLFPDVIGPGDLVRRGAAAVAAMLADHRYGGARLIRCARREDGAELLLVEVIVALGQRAPVNDIREVEAMAIVFHSDDLVPFAYPLRDDFPDVPHLNVSHSGEPRSLCLFEMPPDEALRVATPFVLIERARHWLRETAHGRLHGEDQPLDPLFARSRFSVVLPPGGIPDGEVLAGYRRSDKADFPVMLERVGAVPLGPPPDSPAFACLSLVTPPLPHGRLRTLPRNVGELLETYASLGIDLTEQLRAVIRGWAGRPEGLGLLGRRCLLIVTTPIERAPGQVDGRATKAFFVDRDAGDLGIALGAVGQPPDGGFGLMLGTPDSDRQALVAMPTEALEVHPSFDRSLALAASGGEGVESVTKVALVGAGALGSQIALDAARGGLGRWSIVDLDHLMPHNLARHALGPANVGAPKAQALANAITALLGTEAADATVADVRASGADSALLASVEMVIDASASVPCARWLSCGSRHRAPTSSAFLSPSGGDLVILREGSGRHPRLDHVEMTYYWSLACDPRLAGHLRAGGTIMPSGGCRNPSVQLPQTTVSAFAALATDELFGGPWPPEGDVTVWRRGAEGLTRLSVAGEAFDEVSLDGWTVAVRTSVTAGVAAAGRVAGTSETGGILVGAWDRQRRKGWIVAHLDPPPDSECSPTGFVRGSVGVHHTLEHVETTTEANLTYVGEWHTHPRDYPSTPSGDDRLLLRWIGDAVAFSDVPPLMLIAGGDGVRLLLGSVHCSTLLPPPNANPGAEPDDAAARPSGSC